MQLYKCSCGEAGTRRKRTLRSSWRLVEDWHCLAEKAYLRVKQAYPCTLSGPRLAMVCTRACARTRRARTRRRTRTCTLTRTCARTHAHTHTAMRSAPLLVRMGAVCSDCILRLPLPPEGGLSPGLPPIQATLSMLRDLVPLSCSPKPAHHTCVTHFYRLPSVAFFVIQHGTEWRSAAQHSTAQHSTAHVRGWMTLVDVIQSLFTREVSAPMPSSHHAYGHCCHHYQQL